MKIKTKLPGVYIEPFSSIITSAKNLWCEGILHTPWSLHFCFAIDKEHDIYVITIHRTSPYRVCNEGQERYIDKYFENDFSDEEWALRVPKVCRAWKLWGTDYINELDANNEISGLPGPRNMEIHQYFIRTEDEMIEFISKTEPKIEIFEKTDFKTVAIHFIDTDCDSF